VVDAGIAEQLELEATLNGTDNRREGREQQRTARVDQADRKRGEACAWRNRQRAPRSRPLRSGPTTIIATRRAKDSD
jgi:hypothetical protein